MKQYLSEEEFLSHFYLYKHGNKQSLALLVEENQGLVRAVADRHATHVIDHGLSAGLGSQVAWDDLVQSGNVGLLKALQRFEPGRAKFSTYAYDWIEKEIRLHINTCLLIKQVRGSYRPVTSVEGVSAKKDLERIWGRSQRQPKEGEPPEIIHWLLNVLTEQEQQALRLRFGLTGGKEHTLREIAQALGTHTPAVCKILDSGLLRLKTSYSLYLETGQLIHASEDTDEVEYRLVQIARERYAVIAPYVEKRVTISDLYRTCGFPQATVRKWIIWYEEKGMQGLIPKHAKRSKGTKPNPR